ncbi:ATP/GTP-binding protein [Microbacterium sp. NPDC058269]|uniref:GTP-binding protein n=1 Tax=Microbacterium sp. NPDC058269 TaxID=3346414 RepID=UPI0036D7B4CD
MTGPERATVHDHVAGETVEDTSAGSGSWVRTTPSDLSTRRARWRRVSLPTRFRLVFAGPVGAGKTTAVRALSDVAPVDTDVPISAGSAEYGDGEKTTTTVGLDYGAWKPTEEISVALIGVPGQDRFAHTRQSASSSDTRILLWLRADRGRIADDADAWLPRFAGDHDRLVIAVTHGADDAIDSVRAELTESLERYGIPLARVLAADARDRESVMRAACVALDLPEEES